VPGSDPSHWLHRLTADEWLAAADTELRHCEEALARRAVRPGVTHARRAAGMGLNAMLAVAEDARFGRSYMDHVVALATGGDKGSDDGLGGDEPPADVRGAAQLLRQTPAAPPPLITLGKPDLQVLQAARRIVAYAAHCVARRRAPIS
jgi:hypothetical protein